MNYEKALKLLLRIESPQLVSSFNSNPDALDRLLQSRINEKFTFVVAMQRYASFDREELENVELLMKIYPGLKISYLEDLQLPVSELGAEEAGTNIGGRIVYVNLIDGSCPIGANGKRTPLFKIQVRCHG
jgi:1,3-beta-glucan synthase